MLKISRLADYATNIMHFLARREVEPFSASAIAQQTLISAPTVSKILKLLLEADLLISTRGVNGGYRLAASPKNISIAAIISAIDGRPSVTECAKANHRCEHDQNCELRDNWQIINQAIWNYLDNLSLAEMATPLKRNKESPIHYYPPAKMKERPHA